MTLSSDDKQRIYEEEKERLEAQKKLKLEKQRKGCLGCLGVGVAFVIIMLIIYGISSIPRRGKTTRRSSSLPPTNSTPSSTKKSISKPIQQHTSGTETLKILRGTDDGYAWRKAPHEARIDLCKDIAKRIGKHNGQYYYDNIEAFYETEEPGILRVKIAEAAGMISVLPSASQQEEALSKASERGKVSARDREIHAYLQNRWDFYERRDGRYIQEQHDPLVVSEGASRFSLTNAEITRIFRKVEQIRWGTE